MTDDIDALATTTDATVGELPNMSNAPDDALLVAEYLGKARNSTLGQLKVALGAITGFEKTAGDCTPGTTDAYTITFANGGKLDILIPIPLNGKDGYTPQKGVDYVDGKDGYTPQKGVDYDDGKDGFSPIVDFKEVTDGVEITITDKTGPHTAKLKNGADGVSPSFRTEVIEGGYRVILSAANEYQQFDLLNGECGDWSVNNPAWKNYIKGRTHWKEEYGADGEIIPEVSAAFSGTFNFTTVAGAISEGITAKGKYVVTWNGTEYSCEGKEYWDGPYVGNGSIMDSSQEDTGEPFAILMFGDDLYQVWKADKTKETVTVKVVGEKVVIWHKLDGGYLDEALQFGETIAEVFPETTFTIEDGSNGVEFAATVHLVEGGDYVVMYNSVRYDCVCSTHTEDNGDGTSTKYYILGNFSALVGTGDTGEPFVFLVIPSAGGCAVAAFDGSTSITLSIFGSTIRKLDNKYLDLEWIPGGVANRVEVVPETTLDEPGTVPLTDAYRSSVELNAPYIVTWNGVEYLVRMFGAIGDTYLGNASLNVPHFPNTGEPFIMSLANINMTVYYEGSEPVTFKIERAYFDTLPYDYAPANYTIPTDMKANNCQSNNDELVHAEYVLRHGGKVYGTIDNAPVEILSLRADDTDDNNYFTWRDLSDTKNYGNLYQHCGWLNDFKSMTPAVDREDIILRSSSGKRFRFTVDDTGALSAAEVTE